MPSVHDAGGWDGLGNVFGGDDRADGDAFAFPGAASADSALDCMRDEDGWLWYTSRVRIRGGWH